MKLDFDSYNDNNEFGAQLPALDLNFQRDLDEAEMGSEYDPYGDEEPDED
jgi:hypothetical protein